MASDNRTPRDQHYSSLTKSIEAINLFFSRPSFATLTLDSRYTRSQVPSIYSTASLRYYNLQVTAAHQTTEKYDAKNLKI